MPRYFRPQVEIDAEIADGVQSCADEREIAAATWWYQWLLTAVQMVDGGLGHLLPQVPGGRAERGSRPEAKTVRWAQKKEDWELWRSKLMAAGTTVPAVLEQAGAACIAAGGDPVAMAWPPHKSLPKVA